MECEKTDLQLTKGGRTRDGFVAMMRDVRVERRRISSHPSTTEWGRDPSRLVPEERADYV